MTLGMENLFTSMWLEIQFLEWTAVNRERASVIGMRYIIIFFVMYTFIYIGVVAIIVRQ